MRGWWRRHNWDKLCGRTQLCGNSLYFQNLSFIVKNGYSQKHHILPLTLALSDFLHETQITEINPHYFTISRFSSWFSHFNRFHSESVNHTFFHTAVPNPYIPHVPASRVFSPHLVSPVFGFVSYHYPCSQALTLRIQQSRTSFHSGFCIHRPCFM